MKQINSYYSLLFLVVSIASCSLKENCTKLYISKKEKTWFKPYRKNELLLFKDSLGNIDTFQTSTISDEFTSCNQFELGEYQYNYLSFGLTKFKSKNKQLVFKMIFTKELQDETLTDCLKYFEFFNLSVDGIVNLDTFMVERVPYLNNMINSYHVDFKINAKSNWWGIRKIEYMNLSKQKGLIRYKYLYGKPFYFWKTIKM